MFLGPWVAAVPGLVPQGERLPSSSCHRGFSALGAGRAIQASPQNLSRPGFYYPLPGASGRKVPKRKPEGAARAAPTRGPFALRIAGRHARSKWQFPRPSSHWLSGLDRESPAPAKGRSVLFASTAALRSSLRAFVLWGPPRAVGRIRVGLAFEGACSDVR